MENLYKTSDTPFAAVLLGLGYICVSKGLNSHNGRVWFGFDIEPGVSQTLEDKWMNDNGDPDSDFFDPITLDDINIMFQLKTNLVRVTKGGTNDPRFTTETWDNNYKA